MGLNKYLSEYTVWADKKGLLPPKQDNETMRIGRDLEEYVASRFCEATGKKVRRNNYMCLHDSYDFISANVDREIVGENAGLECKTTSVFAKYDFENGEFPDYYYCQCMHYMAVMGYDKMYLAVLVLSKGFYYYEIDRNENEIKALIQTEKNWWTEYIINNAVPTTDGSESTGNTIGSIYNTPTTETIYCTSALETETQIYNSLLAKQKEYKALAESRSKKYRLLWEMLKILKQTQVFLFGKCKKELLLTPKNCNKIFPKYTIKLSKQQ